MNYTLYKIGAVKDVNGKLVAWYDREDKTLEINNRVYANIIDDEMAMDCVVAVLGLPEKNYSEDEMLDAEYDLAVAQMGA
jgi:hypothetical protein